MSDQATAPATNSPQINMEERVAQFLVLRDQIDAMKEDLKERLKPYNEAKKMMEAMFLGWLSETKQTSARTEAGTVHILDRQSATIEDADAFRKWIIANEFWHMIDWKANAPQVADWIVQNDGQIPPGLKYSIFRTAGVRRS